MSDPQDLDLELQKVQLDDLKRQTQHYLDNGDPVNALNTVLYMLKAMGLDRSVANVTTQFKDALAFGPSPDAPTQLAKVLNDLSLDPPSRPLETITEAASDPPPDGMETEMASGGALNFSAAHSGSGGHDVAYIEHGSEVALITSGVDGKLCFRSATTPTEINKTVDVRAREDSNLKLTCLAASPSGDFVVVGDDQNYVKMFTYPGGELDRIATRFTLPPRSIAYSSAGSALAVGGDDEGIKLIDTASNKVYRTISAPAYTTGLAYDPEGKFVASICTAGTLTVWTMATGKNEFTVKGLFAKNGPTPGIRTLPAWHPDGGSLIAVPGASGSIQMYERLSWENMYSLDGHTDHVNILSFSKNGLYLASASKDGSVIIWDVLERQQLKKKILPSMATGLAWHPRSNSLALITDDGELAVWQDAVPKDMPGPTADIDAMTGVKKRNEAGGRASMMIDNTADEDDDEGSDDDYDREDSFLDASPGPARNKPNRRSKAARMGRASAAQYDMMMMGCGGVELPEPQAAIQSGSTQLESGRRYLAYNRVGCITLRSENDHNVVEVTFHDTSIARKRVPLLSDFFGFSLGSLGEKGALYASRSAPDAPATIVYRPFEAWAPNSDWSIPLPAGEEPECIAAGETFSAVSTSKRRLRIFSASGLQLYIIDLPGQPVAVAAKGYQLAVAYHAAAPTLSGDQCIQYIIYDVMEGQLVQSAAALPLSAGATLTWFSYTEEGALATYDSEGIVRVRTPSFGGSWVPMFSAAQERKGSEHFWIFSVSAKEVQCIVSAGRPEPSVPSGSARPVVSAPPVKVPVLAMDEGMAPLEAEMLRSGVGLQQAVMVQAAAAEANDMESIEAAEHAVHTAQVEADRCVLRLYTKLVQADRQARALEAVLQLQTDNALNGALKIAYHHRMSGLAERIAALIEDRAAAAAVQEAPTAAEYGHTAWNTHGEGEQYNDNVDDEQPEENVDEDVENIAQGEDQEQDGEDGKEKEQTMPVFGKKTAALAREQPSKENGLKNSAQGAAGTKRKVSGNPFARKKAAK